MGDDFLLRSLRLWLPEKSAIQAMVAAVTDRWETAVSEHQQTVPNSATDNSANLLGHVAVAIGRSHLQHALDQTNNESCDGQTAAEFRESVEALAWSDLLLAAACVDGQEEANRRLIAIIHQQVLPRLAAKWGRDQAQEIAEELPQRLHLRDERGLNRGRPRLLAYGGRSRLVTWLAALANRLAIDSWRRRGREQLSEKLPKLRTVDAQVADPEPTFSSEELEWVRRVAPQAFVELMLQLRDISHQQYRFAYYRCIRRWDNTAIAAELNVGKSRVTELSQQVFRKLMVIFQKHAPELAGIGNEPSQQRRRLLEEALGDILGETSASRALLGESLPLTADTTK